MLINAVIEEIDLLMCTVAYAVATVLHVLTFIKIEVYKLVLLIDQKYLFHY